MSQGSRVRLALVNGLRRETSADLYEDIAERLRAMGIEVALVHGLGGLASRLRDCNLVVSNMDLPASIPDGLPTYAGRPMSRPTSLQWIERFGVPTMEWTLARSRRGVGALFDAWSAERVLLKSSYTFGGNGVRVFSRSAVWRLHWKRDVDVFCKEVNPDDGDVYKAELLNGRILIGWMSAAPPIRKQFKRGIYRGLRGAYGDRSIWELPSGLAAKMEALSAGLTAEGLGHVSLDLMKRPDGELIAIELNPRGVATWWTRQFPEFRECYAQALYALALRHR